MSGYGKKKDNILLGICMLLLFSFFLWQRLSGQNDLFYLRHVCVPVICGRCDTAAAAVAIAVVASKCKSDEEKNEFDQK